MEASPRRHRFATMGPEPEVVCHTGGGGDTHRTALLAAASMNERPEAHGRHFGFGQFSPLGVLFKLFSDLSSHFCQGQSAKPITRCQRGHVYDRSRACYTFATGGQPLRCYVCFAGSDTISAPLYLCIRTSLTVNGRRWWPPSRHFRSVEAERFSICVTRFDCNL